MDYKTIAFSCWCLSEFLLNVSFSNCVLASAGGVSVLGVMRGLMVCLAGLFASAWGVPIPDISPLVCLTGVLVWLMADEKLASVDSAWPSSSSILPRIRFNDSVCLDTLGLDGCGCNIGPLCWKKWSVLVIISAI